MESNNRKKVKIYGTIGPACSEAAVLREMFREGMDGVRLNLSHTTLDEAADLIQRCRSEAGACGVSPELLIDMQGPELRVGALDGLMELRDGALIAADGIPFPDVVKTVLAESADGQEVLLDDGKILLKKEGSSPDRMPALRVARGGILNSRKSIALPGCSIKTPAMTEKDRRQIALAGQYGVTAVMQPFVRGKEDLIEVREALDSAGCRDIRLFAKIENMTGAEKIEELIPYCDEIVIARGDLGNSMELWELPAVQKRISEVCRREGRDFMVVTQMLESMTHRQVPTRAEVSDIFNAVLDGAASVMVTGETAAGDHPALVIRYLSRTASEAEKHMERKE